VAHEATLEPFAVPPMVAEESSAKFAAPMPAGTSAMAAPSTPIAVAAPVPGPISGIGFLEMSTHYIAPFDCICDM
jgi:hypothetical protein